MQPKVMGTIHTFMTAVLKVSPSRSSGNRKLWYALGEPSGAKTFAHFRSKIDHNLGHKFTINDSRHDNAR